MLDLRGGAAILLSAWALGCASAPQPRVCGLLGGMAGSFGGVVGGEEHVAKGNPRGEGAAIGISAALLGVGAGYLLCRPRPVPSEPKPAESAEFQPPLRLAQASAPRSEAAPAPPPSPPDPCRMPVRLWGVNFDTGQAAIRPEGADLLDRVAGQLRACAGKRLRVGGHSDSVGSESFNLELSARRAEAVRSYLRRAGIAEERMQAIGFGETRPIVSNDSAEGRARNRRVELHPLD